MSIHHDFEKIKTVALEYAKGHNCNYNIIIHNPNYRGEFDLSAGSTYEFVIDNYFDTLRPNVILLCKTDDLLKESATFNMVGGMINNVLGNVLDVIEGKKL